tara:strand:+ start:444 stop:722 length:279 start_codon:yes stop_codon:yes gene_type:complete
MENYFPEHEEKVLFADGFEDAFLGVAEAYGSAPKAAYSISKCLEVLMERDGMSLQDANEFFQTNVAGAYVGEYTPLFIQDYQPEFNYNQVWE